MQRYKLSIIVFFETLYMGLIGVVAGSLASMPIIYYLHENPIPLTGEMAAAFEEFNVQPIMPFAFTADLFLMQALVVAIITVVIAIYPFLNISRFKLINGLRS